MAMRNAALLLAGAAATAAAASKPRPNFVFIFADDMRKDDMVALPRISEEIAARGTFMENFFVNTPVCCPSRTALFSGRYPHNNVAPRAAPSTGPGTTNPGSSCCMHMNLLFGNVTSATSAPNGNCSNPGYWRVQQPALFLCISLRFHHGALSCLLSLPFAR